jgi:hypothetical protein
VHPLRVRRDEEVAALLEEGRQRIGRLTEKEFLVAGAALYAGEGDKTGAAVKFANSDARMILFFLMWLRRFFDIDESRLRVRLYLHEGLDLGPPSSSGHRSPESQLASSRSRTGPGPIRRSGRPNTSRAVRRSATPVPRPIAPSWASSPRC